MSFSVKTPCVVFLVLPLRWTFTGAGSKGWPPATDRLPVDVLLILLASNCRFDFLLSRNDAASADESFGDS